MHHIDNPSTLTISSTSIKIFQCTSARDGGDLLSYFNPFPACGSDGSRYLKRGREVKESVRGWGFIRVHKKQYAVTHGCLKITDLECRGQVKILWNAQW